LGRGSGRAIKLTIVMVQTAIAPQRTRSVKMDSSFRWNDGVNIGAVEA
jgi:hypothetical protein